MNSRKRILIGVVSAFLALVPGAATPVAAAKPNKKRACNEWAHQSPHELTRSQARRTVVCLLNRERQAAGLRSLDRVRSLERAAQQHNGQMTGTGCFSHQCPGESALEGRLVGSGYLSGGLRAWVYAENLAWGIGPRGTPSAAVAAWMDSPPHRVNVLDSRVRDVGVGFATGSPMSRAAEGGIYTADFGFRDR